MLQPSSHSSTNGSPLESRTASCPHSRTPQPHSSSAVIANDLHHHNKNIKERLLLLLAQNRELQQRVAAQRAAVEQQWSHASLLLHFVAADSDCGGGSGGMVGQGPTFHRERRYAAVIDHPSPFCPNPQKVHQNGKWSSKRKREENEDEEYDRRNCRLASTWQRGTVEEQVNALLRQQDDDERKNGEDDFAFQDEGELGFPHGRQHHSKTISVLPTAWYGDGRLRDAWADGKHRYRYHNDFITPRLMRQCVCPVFVARQSSFSDGDLAVASDPLHSIERRTPTTPRTSIVCVGCGGYPRNRETESYWILQQRYFPSPYAPQPKFTPRMDRTLLQLVHRFSGEGAFQGGTFPLPPSLRMMNTPPATTNNNHHVPPPPPGTASEGDTVTAIWELIAQVCTVMFAARTPEKLQRRLLNHEQRRLEDDGDDDDDKEGENEEGGGAGLSSTVADPSSCVGRTITAMACAQRCATLFETSESFSSHEHAHLMRWTLQKKLEGPEGVASSSTSPRPPLLMVSSSGAAFWSKVSQSLQQTMGTLRSPFRCAGQYQAFLRPHFVDVDLVNGPCQARLLLRLLPLCVTMSLSCEVEPHVLATLPKLTLVDDGSSGGGKGGGTQPQQYSKKWWAEVQDRIARHVQARFTRMVAGSVRMQHLLRACNHSPPHRSDREANVKGMTTSLPHLGSGGAAVCRPLVAFLHSTAGMWAVLLNDAIAALQTSAQRRGVLSSSSLSSLLPVAFVMEQQVEQMFSEWLRQPWTVVWEHPKKLPAVLCYHRFIAGRMYGAAPQDGECGEVAEEDHTWRGPTRSDGRRGRQKSEDLNAAPPPPVLVAVELILRTWTQHTLPTDQSLMKWLTSAGMEHRRGMLYNNILQRCEQDPRPVSRGDTMKVLRNVARCPLSVLPARRLTAATAPSAAHTTLHDDDELILQHLFGSAVNQDGLHDTPAPECTTTKTDAPAAKRRFVQLIMNRKSSGNGQQDWWSIATSIATTEFGGDLTMAPVVLRLWSYVYSSTLLQNNKQNQQEQQQQLHIGGTMMGTHSTAAAVGRSVTTQEGMPQKGIGSHLRGVYGGALQRVDGRKT